MKKVQEYYQDWYNERSGDPEMNLDIHFVDKAACEFAEYYAKKCDAISKLLDALTDIKNWDEDLEDEWEDAGYRAIAALAEYKKATT